MQLQLSSRAAATLVYRLCAPKLSPVAKAAAKHEKALARVFLKAIKEAQDAVPMGELESVLNVPGTGAPLYVLQPVFDLLLEQTEQREYTPYMRVARAKKTVESVLLDTMEAGAKAQPLAMEFDAANPEAVAWAERNAARLVTDVTRDAQAAIRAVVTDGIANGVSPSETARLIRSSIGLTERDASAVMKRQLELLSQGVPNATERAKKYAAKLTRRRAQTIARTETMRAANEGQQQLWQQAKQGGFLTGRERKVWLTSDPCPICAELDGEEVPLDGTFSIGMDPPAHPNCRCTLGLVA